MSNATKNNLKRLGIEIQAIKDCASDLSGEINEVDSHIAWGQFLSHFKLASALIVRIGMADCQTRGKAHRLKNQLDFDPVLKYLIASRNQNEHPEDLDREVPFVAEYDPGTIGYGSFFKIGAKSNIDVRNCSVDGRIVNASSTWDEESGQAITTSNVDLDIERPLFRLLPVTTLQGNVIEVPELSVEGEIDTGSTCIKFADHALRWIMDSQILLGISGSPHISNPSRY